MKRFAVIAGGAVLVALATGTVEPADGRFERTLTASERVTLLARPTVLRGNALATLFGSVDNGREGEMVTIQAKDCGQRFFTGVAAATTRAGGTWTADFSRYITTSVRAVWKDAASAPVTIRQVPEIALYRRGARRFEVFISSKGQFWRKTILFQRRDSGSWRTLKSVVLTDTYSQPGRPIVATAAEFTAPVPKGSLVRAVLPLSQARPCYLAGVSKTVRT